MNADLGREQALIEDAASVLARLDGEAEELAAFGADDTDAESAARAKLAEAETALAASEAALGTAQSAFSNVEAQRNALNKNLRDETQRYSQFEAELAKVSAELAALRDEIDRASADDGLSAAFEAARAAAETAEKDMLTAEAAHAELRRVEAETRGPWQDAERKAQSLATEAQTLAKLLSTPSGSRWPAVVEEISVAKGYEAALGAALGDDLDASIDVTAPAYWDLLTGYDDPALPAGVNSLAQHVNAPPALARRLAQIGVIAQSAGKALQAQLRPGQRAVSWKAISGAGTASALLPKRRRPRPGASPKRTGLATLRETPRLRAGLLTKSKPKPRRHRPICGRKPRPKPRCGRRIATRCALSSIHAERPPKPNAGSASRGAAFRTRGSRAAPDGEPRRSPRQSGQS